MSSPWLTPEQQTWLNGFSDEVNGITRRAWAVRQVTTRMEEDASICVDIRWQGVIMLMEEPATGIHEFTRLPAPLPQFRRLALNIDWLPKSATDMTSRIVFGAHDQYRENGKYPRVEKPAIKFSFDELGPECDRGIFVESRP